MYTEIICKKIVYGSSDYSNSIELRRELLRKPLGLEFTPHDLEYEDLQNHFAAFNGDTLIATLVLKPADFQNKSIIKMRQVAVSPEFQSKGVGKQLVEFSEKWARKNQFHRIELHARKTAIEFYKSMNYQASGFEFIEVGIPHVLMYKIL